MPLIPLNDSVFGEPIVRDKHAGLMNEVATLTAEFEETLGKVVSPGGSRELTASLAPEKVPFQIRVTSVAEGCKEVQEGDLAILPVGGGTMVTITKSGEARRLYMISEKNILAVLRDSND